LEETVGARSLPAQLKSIDALDGHCERLLAASPFAALAWSDARGEARVAALGGAPGFARAASPKSVRAPLPAGVLPPPGSRVALIFFVPGLGETLRVNGRATPGEGLEVAVEEAFVHCAKALIRSALWKCETYGAAPSPAAPPEPPAGAERLDAPEVRAFLARAPLLVLGSRDLAGGADASPKGDPPGFVRVLGGGTLAVPDRPGNRRTDTFHNLLGFPRVALLALVPGDSRTLEVSGRASLSRDPELLATLAVQGKLPKLALLLQADAVHLAPSRELAAAALWDPSRHVPLAELPPIAEVLADHVRQNRQRGVAAAALRKLVSARRLAPALARDYEDGLY
jgi:uncharacterized protein